MDNLNARIEELNWVLRQIAKSMDEELRVHSAIEVQSITLDTVETDIIGRILALENEALAKEATTNGGR